MRQSVPRNSFATLRDVHSSLGAGRIDQYFMQHAAHILHISVCPTIAEKYRKHYAVLFFLEIVLSTLEHLPPLASTSVVIAARPRELIRTIDQARFFAVYLLVRKRTVCATNAIKVSGVK